MRDPVKEHLLINAITRSKQVSKIIDAYKVWAVDLESSITGSSLLVNTTVSAQLVDITSMKKTGQTIIWARHWLVYAALGTDVGLIINTPAAVRALIVPQKKAAETAR